MAIYPTPIEECVKNDVDQLRSCVCQRSLILLAIEDNSTVRNSHAVIRRAERQRSAGLDT